MMMMNDPQQPPPQMVLSPSHCASLLQMMMDPDMIGAIKIKDGLFIGDELAASVRPAIFSRRFVRTSSSWSRTKSLT